MMNDPRGFRQAGELPAGGLCDNCRHAKVIVSSRGSRFLLCGYAALDERYPRYPPLPVLRCAAYAPQQ